MRILRLTNSDDFTRDVAENDRGYQLVAAAMKDATGEDVETIVKVIWPADDLPDIVERWVTEYRPDIVFLKVNSYWYTYESVPLKLRRRFGRIGQAAGDAGQRATEIHWLARTRAFKKARALALSTIGGETHFSVDYVIKTVEAVSRRVLRHEDVILVVRGSRGGSERPDLPKKVEARRHARRDEGRERLRALCAQLNVPLLMGNNRRKFDPAKRGSDGFHSNARGHADVGNFEAEGLVRIWRELHPDRVADAAG